MEGDFVAQLFAAAFEKERNELYAERQSAYMKGHFPFFGLPMPIWNPIAKRIISTLPTPDGAMLFSWLKACMDYPEREMHYAAFSMAEKWNKKQASDWIESLEWLILQKSWWDGVDWIAKLVGQHLKRYPELQVSTAYKWMESDKMWLQRVAIIFQLTYKDKTDEKLLFDMVLAVAESKAFFLQKAAGWALRQYAKTSPKEVIAFVQSHELPNLTKKEALKHFSNGKK